MNCIPLPDELLRKVYGYILPIFEYTCYLNAVVQHKVELEEFEQIVDSSEMALTLDDKIEYNIIISSYACLMNEYLVEIRDFLKTNLSFERPAEFTNLTEHQYKRRGDTEYLVMQAFRMESNINIRRNATISTEMTDHPILIYGDMLFMLRNGSLAAIIHYCHINNIDVDNDPYSQTVLDIHGKDCYRNYLVRLLMML